MVSSNGRTARPRRIFAVLLAIGTLLATGWPPAPARASVIYTGAGFDTCSAPSLNTMSAWLASPYRSLGIYVGGANRACGDGNLSAGWVSSVEAEGWRLAPLYVGLQAPCVLQGGLATIDPAAAAQEGTAAADDAVARAEFFGIGPANPIYFDMEAYGNDPVCIQAVLTFLSAWTVELHQAGYTAGVYGSSGSTITFEASAYNDCTLVVPDAIWFANWNGQQNIFGDPFFPDADWANHQRLHQYLGGHVESYGGVAIDIDSDFDDGPLAGAGPLASAAGRSIPPPVFGRATVTNAIVGPLGWVTAPVGRAPSVGAAGGPAVAAWAPCRLDVFVVGKNGHVWHEWSTEGGQSFSGWEDLGGPAVGLLGSPAAVSWGNGRLDIFARGQDNGLWHLWFDTTSWGVWERIGGPITSSPAVASWGPGRLDIFGNLPDRSVGHWWWDQTAWFGLEPLGGLSFEDPAAVSWGPGRIDLFIVSTGSAIVHKWWGGTQWLGWASDVAGAWATTPAVASWGPGRLDLFAGFPTLSGSLDTGHDWFDQTAWFGPEDRGCCLVAAPAAVSWGIDRIDVFGLESNGNLIHFFFGS